MLSYQYQSNKGENKRTKHPLQDASIAKSTVYADESAVIEKQFIKQTIHF